MLFPSPCIGVREVVGEASAGACAGLVLSRESRKVPGCRHRPDGGRQHEDARYRERISTRRGPRPRHVQKPFVGNRESWEPAAISRGPHREGSAP